MDLVEQFESLGFEFTVEVRKSIEDGEKRPRRKERKDNTDTVYANLLVTPLIEIYSVSLHNKLVGDEKLEIYGRVRVVDKLGDDFDLFVRSKDDAERIDNGGTLLLCPPSLDSNGVVNVVIPSENVSVDVRLFDKAHNNMVIAEDELTLNVFTLDCREEMMSMDLRGTAGYARVDYALVPFAVVASVDILYFSKDDEFDRLGDDVKVPKYDDDYSERFDEMDYIKYDTLECGSSNVAHVYGIVKARCDSLDPSVLFRKTPEQSMQVMSRSFITLSRSIVVVPANSSLGIEVDLYDGDTQLPICTNTVEFKPQDENTYKKDIVGDNGRIRIRVTWNDAYQQLCKPNAIVPDVGNVVEEKRPKLLSGQELHVNTASSSMPPSMPSIDFDPTPYVHKTPMIEVFSIAVCGKQFEPFDFYGHITVNVGDFTLFDKDENSPQHCPALGTQVELNCLGIFTFIFVDEFGLWVALKDVNGLSISNGHIVWRKRDIIPERKELVGKRLCSIIRGDGGFATVYYSVFMDALAAVVSVKLHGNTSSNLVYGNLVARYGSRDYSSSYDRKYYQSILFNKDAEEGLTVETGGSIPLLKPVFAAPRNSFIVIKADLFVVPVNGVGCNLPQETLSLLGSVEFHVAYGPQVVLPITGQNVKIEVSVKFVDELR